MNDAAPRLRTSCSGAASTKCNNLRPAPPFPLAQRTACRAVAQRAKAGSIKLPTITNEALSNITNLNGQTPMYVYILKSTAHTPAKYYVGITSNLNNRITEHNAGKCKATTTFKPWSYKNFFWFENDSKAFAFEKYLKSGSGRAFAKLHF